MFQEAPAVIIYDKPEQTITQEKFDAVVKALARCFTYKEQEDILLEYVYDKLVEILNSLLYGKASEAITVGKYRIYSELNKLLYPLNKQDFFVVDHNVNPYDPSSINFRIHRNYAEYPRSNEEWAELDKKA